MAPITIVKSPCFAMPRNRSRNVCYEYAASRTCRFGQQCKFSHVQSNKSSQTKVRRVALPIKLRDNNRWQNSAQSRRRQRAQPQDNIDAFFANYSDFQYQRSAPIVEEFYRMCDFFGWEKDDEERKTAHEDFKVAMVHDFNNLYGTDVNDIESWQKLCLALNITPLPQDIAGCRKVSPS